MGADYRAKALIGIKIDDDDLFIPKKTKAFNHDYPEDFTHDPKSGRPLWTELSSCVLDDFNADEDEYKGFDIVIEDGCTYFCIAIADDTYSNGGNVEDSVKIDFDKLAKRKEALKKLLSKYGLWKDTSFGLWTVLHCSY